MNKQECREMLEILISEFKVKKPIFLKWSHRTKAGLCGRHYSYSKFSRCKGCQTKVGDHYVITLGPNSWAGIENTLIHEFSHAMASTYNNHNKIFRKVLCKVAETWYGDITKYSWGREYKTIKKMAIIAGYHKERTK
jgi:hypothetical protein